MTDEERDALLGDELTKAIGVVCRELELTHAQRVALANYSAVLVGKCSTMIAGAMVDLYRRMDQLERGDASD